MKTTQLIIVQNDLELLRSHLSKGDLSEFNRNKLRTELREARVVSQDMLPPDAVSLNSYVEILDISQQHQFSFRLVMPAEADIKKNKISVFAPMGVALLGYKASMKVQWEMPNGVKTFEILKVVQNPEEQEV